MIEDLTAKPATTPAQPRQGRPRTRPGARQAGARPESAAPLPPRWHCIVLSARDLHGIALLQCTFEDALFRHQPLPPDCALFCRDQDDGGTVLLITPAAAPALPRDTFWGPWQPCDPPPRQGTQLLFGHRRMIPKLLPARRG